MDSEKHFAYLPREVIVEAVFATGGVGSSNGALAEVGSIVAAARVARPEIAHLLRTLVLARAALLALTTVVLLCGKAATHDQLK